MFWYTVAKLIFTAPDLSAPLTGTQLLGLDPPPVASPPTAAPLVPPLELLPPAAVAALPPAEEAVIPPVAPSLVGLAPPAGLLPVVFFPPADSPPCADAPLVVIDAPPVARVSLFAVPPAPPFADSAPVTPPAAVTRE